jgi:hypothetical protein
MLGFICHIKASDQLLLLTNVHSKVAVQQLLYHPALPVLESQGKRLAAIIHLADAGLAGSKVMRQLVRRLQPLAAMGAAAGQQLLLRPPGVLDKPEVGGASMHAQASWFCCVWLSESTFASSTLACALLLTHAPMN